MKTMTKTFLILCCLILCCAFVALSNIATAQDAPQVATPDGATPCQEAFQRELAALSETSGSCDQGNVARAFEAVRQTCAGELEQVHAWVNGHCPDTAAPTPAPVPHRTATPFRYICIDRAQAVQRHGRTIRCDCPDDLREVDVDRRTARQELRYDRRTVVVTCTNPNPAAEGEGRDHVERDWTPILDRLDALEAACDRPEEDMTPGWRDLCSRVSSIEMLLERHEVQLHAILDHLIDLESRVSALETEVFGISEGACGISPSELGMLTQTQITDRCRAFVRAPSSSEDTRLNFQLGVGARVFLHSEMGVMSGFAVAFAQWEPMLSSERHLGFYVRGLIGYGNVGDQPGQFGQVPLGASGIWGLSAGLATRGEHLAFNVGLAFDSSLVPGTRGQVIGEYRWHTLGPEFRLRWNPVDFFGLELSLEPAWSHAEVDLPNTPDLGGVNGFGLASQVGVEFTF